MDGWEYGRERREEGGIESKVGGERHRKKAEKKVGAGKGLMNEEHTPSYA